MSRASRPGSVLIDRVIDDRIGRPRYGAVYLNTQKLS
jgi:hypothetical protein